MRQFEPAVGLLFFQPSHSHAACLASGRLSLVHLIPQQHTVRDQAWSGTPPTLPPGFEPSLDQRLSDSIKRANINSGVFFHSCVSLKIYILGTYK